MQFKHFSVRCKFFPSMLLLYIMCEGIHLSACMCCLIWNLVHLLCLCSMKVLQLVSCPEEMFSCEVWRLCPVCEYEDFWSCVNCGCLTVTVCEHFFKSEAALYGCKINFSASIKLCRIIVIWQTTISQKAEH